MLRLDALIELLRAPNPQDLITLEDAQAHSGAFTQLMQSISECADVSLLRDLAFQRPWLKEFYGSNDSEGSISAFREDVMKRRLHGSNISRFMRRGLWLLPGRRTPARISNA